MGYANRKGRIEAGEELQNGLQAKERGRKKKASATAHQISERLGRLVQGRVSWVEQAYASLQTQYRAGDD